MHIENIANSQLVILVYSICMTYMKVYMNWRGLSPDYNISLKVSLSPSMSLHNFFFSVTHTNTHKHTHIHIQSIDLNMIYIFAWLIPNVKFIRHFESYVNGILCDLYIGKGRNINYFFSNHFAIAGGYGWQNNAPFAIDIN